MKSVFLKGQDNRVNLEREVKLKNGSIIITKENDNVVGIYLVISFRDNKNVYNGCNTSMYCSLIDLDSGQLVFEERCSRKTTVRRVLNHIKRLGGKFYSANDLTENYYLLRNNDIEIHEIGTYKMEIILGNIGGLKYVDC